MKCPQCGTKGTVSDDRFFEVRGQVDGRRIRRCMTCDAGLAVGSLGRARLIPDPIWTKMCAEWERNFGPAPAPEAGLRLAADSQPGLSSTATADAAIDRDEPRAFMRGIRWRERLRDDEIDEVAEEIFEAAMNEFPPEFEPWLQRSVELAPYALTGDRNVHGFYEHTIRFLAWTGVAVRMLEEPLTRDLPRDWVWSGLAEIGSELRSDPSDLAEFWADAAAFAAEFAQTRPELRTLPDTTDVHGFGYDAVLHTGVVAVRAAAVNRPDDHPVDATPSGWPDVQIAYIMFALFYGYGLACARGCAPFEE